MASTGDYDRLKDVYGLSDEEIAAIKTANKPKTTGGGGGNPKPVYTKLTHEDRQLMQKEVAKATSTGQLSDLVSLYLSMGYDPAQINSLTAAKANELSASDGAIDTTVPTAKTNLPSLQERQEELRRQAANKKMQVYETTR